jgi:CYTH domain-containing protein
MAHRIVLTGGPCGGKTSALGFISDKLVDKGYGVVTVPESATLMHQHGFELTTSNDFVKTIIKQTAIISCQKTLEDSMAAMESISGKPTVVLSDRGVMDAKAYTPAEYWDRLLLQINSSETELRDARYDAVFHMVSAAVGTNFYTNSNNAARFETEIEAVDADKRTQNAWLGHPHLRIIDNSTDFDGKLNRLWKSIESSLTHQEIERRFLVKSWIPPSDVLSIDIAQTYLRSNDGTTRRVRKRNQDKPLFYFTTKEGTGLIRTEHEELINYSRYNTLLHEADSERQPIFKTRKYFIWNNRQYELDIFTQPNGLKILEIEIDNPNENIDIPPFILVDKEVTNDPTYSNWALAARV